MLSHCSPHCTVHHWYAPFIYTSFALSPHLVPMAIQSSGDLNIWNHESLDKPVQQAETKDWHPTSSQGGVTKYPLYTSGVPGKLAGLWEITLILHVVPARILDVCIVAYSGYAVSHFIMGTDDDDIIYSSIVFFMIFFITQRSLQCILIKTNVIW